MKLFSEVVRGAFRRSASSSSHPQDDHQMEVDETEQTLDHKQDAGKPSEMTARDLGTILQKLEYLERSELQALHQQLTGGSTSQRKDRIVKTLQSLISSELSERLNIKQMKEIMGRISGVKIYKHNDKIPGQIRKLAVSNEQVLSGIIEALQPAGSQDQPSQREAGQASGSAKPQAGDVQNSSNDRQTDMASRTPHQPHLSAAGDDVSVKRREQRGTDASAPVASKSGTANRPKKAAGCGVRTTNQSQHPVAGGGDGVTVNRQEQTGAGSEGSEPVASQTSAASCSSQQQEPTVNDLKNTFENYLSSMERDDLIQLLQYLTGFSEGKSHETEYLRLILGNYIVGKLIASLTKEKIQNILCKVSQRSPKKHRYQLSIQLYKLATSNENVREAVFEAIPEASPAEASSSYQQQEPAVPEAANKTDQTVNSLKNLLLDLGTMERDTLVKVNNDLTGSTDGKKQETSYLRDKLKGHIVGKLIDSLRTPKKRKILRDVSSVSPYKHKNKLSGQLKQQAMSDADVLIAVINAISEESPADETEEQQDDPAEVEKQQDCPAEIEKQFLLDILDQIQKVPNQPRAALEQNYFILFNKHFGKKQVLKRLQTAVTKKLYSNFVNLLEKEEVQCLLNELQPVGKRGNLVNILSKEGNIDDLKAFVNRRQLSHHLPPSEFPESPVQPARRTGAGCVTQQPDHPSVAQASQQSTSNIPVVGVGANPMPGGSNPWFVSSAEARAAFVLSKDDWNDTDIFPNDRLIDLHKRLGSSSRTVQSRASMITFCRRAIADMLVAEVPDYVQGIILQCHSISVPRKTFASNIKRKIIEDDDIRKTFCLTHQRILDGEIINDLTPLNKWKMDCNQSILKDIRQERLRVLTQEGVLHLVPENTSRNPILEAGKEIEQELDSYRLIQCSICEEERPGLVSRDKCERCNKERKPPNGKPYKFHKHNNMNPGPAPPELSNLSLVEQCGIAQIASLMKVVHLRGGGTKMKGSSISFAQDIKSFAKTLPVRPEDLPLVVIKSPYQQHPLKANSKKMRAALEWLKRHNKYYNDIEISEENLQLYPDTNDEAVELRYIDSNEREQEEEEQEEEVAGADEDQNYGAENDDDYIGSCVNHEIPLESTRARLENAFSDNDTQSVQSNVLPPELEWPARAANPISEFKTEGFLCMSYPHLFPHGVGDWTQPCIADKPQLMDYVDHLLWLKIEGEAQNRFAADPRFLFHMVNMHQRHQALMLGNVFADKICKDMNLEKLKQIINDRDSPLLKSLTLMSGQVAGTNGYFSRQRKNALAIEKFIRISTENQERFNVFMTFSLPDNHMVHLHKLLPGSERYLGKTVVREVPEEELGENQYIDKKTDYCLRQKAVNENGHIVNWFAHKRLELVMEKISKECLGVMDYVVRCEYQARSAVHFHMVCRLVCFLFFFILALF